MGINISASTGLETVGVLDIDFPDEISVTDDGDDTVTLNVPTDRSVIHYGNLRGRL